MMGHKKMYLWKTVVSDELQALAFKSLSWTWMYGVDRKICQETH